MPPETQAAEPTSPNDGNPSSRAAVASAGMEIRATGGMGDGGGDEEQKGETWKEAWRQAGERGEDECPICMCSMEKIQVVDKQ